MINTPAREKSTGRASSLGSSSHLSKVVGICLRREKSKWGREMQKKAVLGGEGVKNGSAKKSYWGGSSHTNRSFVQSLVLFHVSVLILTRPYVCVDISSSGFVLGPEVFKKGHPVCTEDEAKCLVYADGWGLEGPDRGF